MQCHLAPDLPLVMADSIQLEQIALNLLRNGMDAVEFMGHLGELTLHTSSDSGMVRLSIADNGKGIAKGDFEKLFQPFFTNKASGMGLGLTISIDYVVVTNKFQLITWLCKIKRPPNRS